MYGYARKSYLLMLDPIQKQATYMSGCFPSLHVEANEMPLDLRRRMLSSEYCLRVSSLVHNLVRSCILTPQFTKFFDKYPNHIQ